MFNFFRRLQIGEILLGSPTRQQFEEHDALSSLRHLKSPMQTGTIKNWQDQELVDLKGRTLDKIEYSLSDKDLRTPHKFSFFFVDAVDEIYCLSVCVTSFEAMPHGWHRHVGQVVSSAYKATDDMPRVLIHFKDASSLCLGQMP